jgi:hypothetical protein
MKNPIILSGIEPVAFRLVVQCLNKLRHCACPHNIHVYCSLTINLLTTTIVAPPSNASKWQMGFNLASKGLMLSINCSVLKRMKIKMSEN